MGKKELEALVTGPVIVLLIEIIERAGWWAAVVMKL
jgi:hypothetical protein